MGWQLDKRDVRRGASCGKVGKTELQMDRSRHGLDEHAGLERLYRVALLASDTSAPVSTRSHTAALKTSKGSFHPYFRKKTHTAGLNPKYQNSFRYCPVPIIVKPWSSR
jgi:hypothetical protein